MKRRTVTSFAAVGILGFSTFAHATTFSITDVKFCDLVGNTTGFTWSVSPTTIANFDLTAGQSTTFTYGTFSTTDISDAKKISDSFTASFMVNPPGTIEQAGEVLQSIHIKGNSYGVQVNADNTLQSVLFGCGGKYTLTFLDPAELDTNGSVDLQARLSVIAEPGTEPDSSPAPVPEPATMTLLAAGFAGLGVFRKCRRK